MYSLEKQLSFALSYGLAFFIMFYHHKSIKKYIVNTFNHSQYQGTALFLFVSVVGMIFFLPITLFNSLSLVLYSPTIAFFISILNHALSASMIYAISKWYVPHIVQQEIAGLPILHKLTQLTNFPQKQYLWLSTLTRLSPNFPFALVSYMWSFTHIPFSAYLIGTIIGCIPYLLLEFFMLRHAGQLLSDPYNMKHILFVAVSIVISFGLGEYITHVVKQELVEYG